MLTSTEPGEGKSFIAASLAQSYALSGKKVLIIDCDLRRGRQYEIFGVSNGKGLSNILISDLSGVKIETIKTKLIDMLENNYDIIIFDCPPVVGLSDALVVTKYVSTTVIVTAYKQTSEDMLKKTVKALEGVNAHIAGVILNKVPATKNGYYNKYYDAYYGG